MNGYFFLDREHTQNAGFKFQISAGLSNLNGELIAPMGMGLRGFKAVWPWAHAAGLHKGALVLEMILGPFL